MSPNGCQGNDDLGLEDLLEWFSGCNSLIHYACVHGYLKVVKELIECNTDVNVLDEYGYTPLHLAAYQGHSEIVILLLANGSEIDIKSGMYGETPLMIAASCGRKEIVKILIEFGADITLVSEKDRNRNSLHLAAIKGQDEIVELMINNGINIDTLDDQNCSPLHLAAVFGNTSTANVLIMKGAEVELQGLNRWTPLLFATYHKKIEVARMLLKQGANLNAVDKYGRTPLHLVIKYWSWSSGEEKDNDRKEFVQLLIDKGADLTMRDEKGKSVLDLCSFHEIGQYVFEYLSRKMYLCPEDLVMNKVNRSLIHYACENGWLRVVKDLIECKTNINGFHNDYAPLHLAASKGHSEIVKLLLANGADINLNSRKEKRSAIHFAVINGHNEIVELLTENGCIIDALDNENVSPLHYVAVKGTSKNAKILVSSGATIDLQGLNKWTPLLAATYHQNIDVARVLLKQGANINAVDMYGSTAMHYILQNKSKGERMKNLDQDFIRLFIDSRARLTIKDSTGKSVFELCREKEIGAFVLDYFSQKKISKEIKSKRFTLKDCIICNNPRQDVFALHPCGHARSCESCCIKLLYSKSSNLRCYMCRTVISDYKKIYF